MPRSIAARPDAAGVAGLLAALLLALGALSANATQLYVDPSGNDANPCTAPGLAACRTIGAAVGKSAGGDTINVAAGMFVEQVTLNKNLTLAGAGAASTTIKLPPAPVADASLGGSTNVVTVRSAAAVSISGVTVTGPGPGICNSINQGIFVVEAAALSLSGSTIASIRDTPLGGCQNGVGVRVGSKALAQIGSGIINGNTILDYQKGGIVIDNAGSTATITGNIVTGVGATPAIAQNGIQVSRGAVATVTGNVVSGNECDNAACGSNLATQDQAAGILLYDAGAGTAVTGNTVTTSDAGLWGLEDALGVGATVLVTNNTFNANRWDGVVVGNMTLNLAGNTASNSLRGIAAVTFTGDARNATINLNGGNIISGNGTGLYLVDANSSAAPIPVINGSQNEIFGNTLGVDNTAGAGTPSLTCNWWGTPFGPINPSSPLGQGNPVDGSATFTNWATNSATFICNGNPANNQLLAAITVPAVSRWHLALLALLLAATAFATFRREGTRIKP